MTLSPIVKPSRYLRSPVKAFSYLGMLTLCFMIGTHSGQVHAEASLTSSFGFTSNMPDQRWFVMGPKEAAKANENESLESLGIPEIQDQAMLEEIFEKLKSGNIEFYYDGRYIKSDYKNHVSVQLSAPLQFESVEQMKSQWKSQCEQLPEELQKVFGEPVKVHSCQLFPSNGRAVFHHAYTLPSQNITIINEQVPVNARYSILFVGGSGNDAEGLKRVRDAQQSLVESATGYLKKQTQGS